MVMLEPFAEVTWSDQIGDFSSLLHHIWQIATTFKHFVTHVMHFNCEQLGYQYFSSTANAKQTAR